MDDKARLRTVLQLLGAGRRRIERAKEHLEKGGFYTNIKDVLYEIDNLERGLKGFM